MRKTITPKEDSPSLDMSSLIDVAFLLLIYFLVTSTLDPKEGDLGMTLPDRNLRGTTPLDIDLMKVEVNSQGHILLNGEVLEPDPSTREVPKLIDRLSTYAESARLMNSEPVVIVEADDAAEGQRFIDVLNALAHKNVGIRRVTIAGFDD